MPWQTLRSARGQARSPRLVWLRNRNCGQQPERCARRGKLLLIVQADVAIIIPAGPGDDAWRDLLPQLDAADVAEIVLVQADDDEATVDTGSHIRVLHAPAGRARQLNAGVNASHAEWLWFLHADSRLTAGTLKVMRDFVGKDADAIGYFRLGFVADGPAGMFLNAWGARLRSRMFGMPFGDQGLLMPRRVFAALGGFDESIGKGEDHALIWAAHARAIPLHALNAIIRTSARRYAEHGWWRTTWQHLRLSRVQAANFSRHERAKTPRERT